MRKNKFILSVLAMLIALSVSIVPSFAGDVQIESIVANTRVGDGQRELVSFEITVNDASLIADLQASDFDIKNNSSTIPFTSDGWANAYEDDGIVLSINGNTITLEATPFCYAGMYKTDGSFQRDGWVVECTKDDNLSFDINDVTELKTEILDDAIRGTFTYAGLTREYALYIPKNSDGTNKTNVPLVVWNHGGGEYAGDLENTLVANKGLTAWPEAGYETAVLQVQIANKNYSYGTSESEERKQLIDQNNALQAALIRKLINDGTVDKNRVYVTGASSGGGATMRFLMQYPELFAGAIACCSMDPIVTVHNQSFATVGKEKPAFDEIVKQFEDAFKGNVYTYDENSGSMVSKQIDTDTLLDVPVFYTHAENDPTCNVDSSKAMYQAMKNLGDDNNKIVLWSNDDMAEDGIGLFFGGALLHWSWVKVFNHNEDGSPMNWLFKQVKVEEKEPAVEAPKNPVSEAPKPTNDKVASVKTGDDQSITLYLVATIITLCGLCFVVKTRTE